MYKHSNLRLGIQTNQRLQEFLQYLGSDFELGIAFPAIGVFAL
jgi:hypothetical protein